MVGLILLSIGQWQTLLQPWRSFIANSVDGLCSACVMMILLCGAMVAQADLDTRVLGVLGCGAAIGVGVAVVAVSGHSFLDTPFASLKAEFCKGHLSNSRGNMATRALE